MKALFGIDTVMGSCFADILVHRLLQVTFTPSNRLLHVIHSCCGPQPQCLSNGKWHSRLNVDYQSHAVRQTKATDHQIKKVCLFHSFLQQRQVKDNTAPVESNRSTSRTKSHP